MALKGWKASICILAVAAYGCSNPWDSRVSQVPSYAPMVAQDVPKMVRSATENHPLTDAKAFHRPPYSHSDSGFWQSVQDFVTNPFQSSTQPEFVVRNNASGTSQVATQHLSAPRVASNTPAGSSSAPQTPPTADTASTGTPTARTLTGEDVKVLVQAAKQMETSGNLPGAVQKFQQALQIDPTRLATWLEFARMYDRHGDARQAVAAYKQAIQADPLNPTPFNDLGICYARHGDLTNATTALRQAVQRNPQRPLYRNNLATVLVAANHLPEALAQLRAAFPPATANYNLAMMLLQQGNQPAAESYLQTAIRTNPNLTPAHEMLAQLRAQTPAGPVNSSTPTAVPAAPNTHMQRPAMSYAPHVVPPTDPRVNAQLSSVVTPPQAVRSQIANPTQPAGSTFPVVPPAVPQRPYTPGSSATPSPGFGQQPSIPLPTATGAERFPPSRGAAAPAPQNNPPTFGTHAFAPGN